MQRRSLRGAGAAIAAGSLLAVSTCGTESRLPSSSNAAGDSLEILSIVPERGARLHLGQTVTFTAIAKYTLASADRAVLSMLVGDDFGRNVKDPDEFPHVDVAKGSGTLTLTDTITVPTPPPNARPVSEIRVLVELASPAGAPVTLIVPYGVD